MDKEIAFTMGIISPITTMAADSKSKILLVGHGSGDCTFLKCSLEGEWDMIPIQ